MTDRLTDEQVRELWEKAKADRVRRAARECWNKAARELGYAGFPRSYLLPHEYEAVRSRAEELRKSEGIDGGHQVHDAPDWTVIEMLVAEVRRARGME